MTTSDAMNEWFDAEQRVERAHELYQSGRWEDALRELKAALQVNPYQGEWHFNMGLTLDALGRFSEAIDCYNKALEFQGEDIEILNNLGNSCTRLGRNRDAIGFLERAEQLDPTNESSYCNRIATFTQLGDHEKAELMFYLACQIDNDNPRSYANISQSLLERGLYDRAIWCLKRVLELDGDDPEIHARLGEAYWLKGDHDEGYRYYLQQLRNYPGDIDTLLDIGNLLIEMKRPIEAAEKFRRAAELDPSNADAHFYLGDLALRSSHLDAAHLALEMAAKYNPRLPAVNQKLALISYKRGRLQECRTYLQNELDLGIEHADSAQIEELGKLLLDAKMAEESVAVYRFLLERDKQENVDPNAHYYHQLAVGLFMMGKLHEGIVYCRQAVRQDDQYVIAMSNLSLAYLQLGDYVRAYYWVRRALTIEGKDSRLRQLRLRVWAILVRRSVGRVFPRWLRRLLRLDV